MLYEVIDVILPAHKIDMLLNVAVTLCPVMRSKLEPIEVKNLFPYEDEEFYVLGAELFNDLAFNF